MSQPKSCDAGTLGGGARRLCQSRSFWSTTTTGCGYTPHSATERRSSSKSRAAPPTPGAGKRSEDEFFQASEIFRSDGPCGCCRNPGRTSTLILSGHRLDEFPTGYSLASCSPAALTPAFPAIRILLDYMRKAIQNFSERESGFIAPVSPQGFTPPSAFLGVHRRPRAFHRADETHRLAAA